MSFRRIAIIVGALLVLAVAGVGAFVALNAQRRVVVGGTSNARTSTPVERQVVTAGALAPAVSPPAQPSSALESSTSTTPAVPVTQPTPLSSPTAPAQPSSTTLATVDAPVIPLPPDQIAASSTAPSSQDSQGNITTFEPINVIDGLADTAWRVVGDGQGQWIELRFARPVAIRTVQILPGYAKIDPFNGIDRFAQNRRVQRVRLEFSDGQWFEAELADRPELQAIELPPIQTTTIRVVILQTTAPGAIDGRDFTPISEIIVFGVAL